MTQEPMEMFGHEERLHEVLAAYLEAIEAGQQPEPDEWLRRYPELAADLAEFFSNQERVAQAAAPLLSVAGAGEVQAARPPEAPTLAPEVQEAASLPPGTRVRYFGDYELLEEIARGGMGVVYKARQVSLNRIVALKMILAGQLASAADVQRFKVEAVAAANLDHPNIVPIYEVGERDGQHYFSMKLVDGRSLGDWIATRRVQTVHPSRTLQADLARLMATAARAVHHAHQRGILHRDLKPANILLTGDGDQERASGKDKTPTSSPHPDSASLTPVLTDFGLAKRVSGDRSLTQSGAIVGTPSYMAPEQARAEKVLTTAVDVYSLGAILYELLTGRPPFRADTPLDTLLQVMDWEPAPPRSLDSQIDRDLETICLRCLEKEPARRYGSAEALAEDLERWLAGEPILARRSTAWERALKWARRRPAIASLIALVAVSTVFGVGGILWQWQQAKAARDQAAGKAQAEEAARQRAEEAQKAEAAARRKAVAERNRAEGLRLAAQSELARPGNPGLALLLAIEGAQRHRNLLTNDALHAALDECRELRTLLGHESEILSACFSKDGRRVLTCSADKTARLWDTDAGKELFVLRGHDAQVVLALFSPDARRALTVCSPNQGRDGRLTSTGYEKPTARLWDAGTGRLIARWQPGTPAPREQFTMSSPFGAAFSPDSRLVVTPFGSYPDCAPRLCEIETGKELHRLRGHQKPVVWVAFSPDSKQIVTASLDETACIWEARTGKLLQTFKGHTCGVIFATFSPDGKRVVTLGDGSNYQFTKSGSGSSSGTATMEDVVGRVWDPTSGKEIAALRWPSPLKGYAVTAAFSPDGRRVLTAGVQGSSVDGFGSSANLHPDIWDATTGKLLLTLKGEERSVVSGAFSADGRYIVTAGKDKTARIWDAGTSAQLVILRGHDGPVHSAVFAPDGRSVLTASEDGTARLWEARIGPALAPVRREWPSVFPGSFSPDGRRLYLPSPTTTYELTARVLDTTTGASVASANGRDWSDSAIFSPDGRHLLTGTWERVGGPPLSFWLLLLPPPPQPQQAAIQVAWQGLLALAGTAVQQGKKVCVLDAATLKQQATLGGHDRRLQTMAFSPDGLKVVTTDGSARVWDVATGKLLRRLNGDKIHVIRFAAFSPDSRRLVTTAANAHRGSGAPIEMGIGIDGQKHIGPQPVDDVWVWDLKTDGKPLVLRGHGGDVSAAVFSPDGTRLVTASEDETIRMWDLTNGKELVALVGHAMPARSAAFSPDGRWLVTGSDDKTARVWDTANGKQCLVLKGHEGPVRLVAWSPDGSWIVTASDDATIRLWDARTGKETAVLKGATGTPQSVRYSTDGRLLLAIFASSRGRRQLSTARIWPVDPLPEALRRKPRDLTPAERDRYELIEKLGD